MMFSGKNSRETAEIEAQEAELQQVLGNFRQSVHAWSVAGYGRARTVVPVSAQPTWRWAAAWALGCALAAGSLSGGLYERHHRQELARIAAQRQVEQERQAAAAAEQKSAAQTGEADADLLAAVDSDVSRQVPSAMEPLAQLMDSNTNR